MRTQILQFVFVAIMIAIPVGFYAYRLVQMHRMGKLTQPKKKLAVQDFSNAFEKDDLYYLNYEQDESVTV